MKPLQHQIIIVLFPVFTVCAILLPAPVAAGTIVVVGDSLSAAYGMRPEQGWVHLLQQRLQPYQAGYQVFNASISGDTTAGGRARLPVLLQQHKPGIVVIELGANDGLRGMSLKAMFNNLDNMIRQSKAAGARVLLIGVRIPPNYGPQYTKGFEQNYRKLAKRHSVSLLPYLLQGISEDLNNMQRDTLHPKAETQQKVLNNVWKRLKPLLDNK